MKKKLFTTAILTAMVTASVAQTITDRFEFGDASRAALSIPKEFSSNGAPYMMMYDSNDKNVLQIYDENLDVVKRITMKDAIPFNYQLTYQEETRDVVAVEEVDKHESSRYDSYDEFVRYEKMLNPTFDESYLIITDLGDGTRKIAFDYSHIQSAYNSQMFFAYNYFGLKYPKAYFIDNGSSFVGYKVNYQVSYSDWKITGTKVVECSKDQERIRLCHVNLNQGDGKTENYFEVSQTLFNDDESFEYIMPKYKMATNSGIYVFIQADAMWDGIVSIETSRTTVISEEKEIALAGFQIISENGDIISDITFDSDFEGRIDLNEAFVITIGKNTYLAFDGQCNNQSSTIFFKIDRKNANAIQKVKIAPSTMKVSPTKVNGGSVINVTFDDANENGSDIVVVSESGVAVNSCHVPAGLTSAQIQTSASAGMYCISRLQKNNVADTKKIIVK